MKPNFDKLTQRLTDLDKKAEELDKLITELRIEINSVIWDLIELKTSKDGKKGN